MNKTQNPQKKRILTTTIYAVIIGLLVLACAIVIATVTSKQNLTNAEIGDSEGDVGVSTTVYVVPVKDATILKDYSATEYQYNDTLKHWEIHKAIDFLAEKGADVYAFADGTVTDVKTNHMEGTYVEITHSNGLVSVYKSMDSKLNVKVGDKVIAGTVIGTVGDQMGKELNSGAHLHFELWRNGDKVDPNDYLALGEK